MTKPQIRVVCKYLLTLLLIKRWICYHKYFVNIGNFETLSSLSDAVVVLGAQQSPSCSWYLSLYCDGDLLVAMVSVSFKVLLHWNVMLRHKTGHPTVAQSYLSTWSITLEFSHSYPVLYFKINPTMTLLIIKWMLYNNASMVAYSNVQRTQTNSLSLTKYQSENRFVCTDFCSDKKSDLSFRQFVCDKKSVCVCWL